MRAVGKYIVIEPFKQEEKTKNGIYLATDDERGTYKPGRGKVISTGIDVKDITSGDVIVFKKHHEIPDFENEGVWLVSCESVIAVE